MPIHIYGYIIEMKISFNKRSIFEQQHYRKSLRHNDTFPLKYNMRKKYNFFHAKTIIFRAIKALSGAMLIKAV